MEKETAMKNRILCFLWILLIFIGTCRLPCMAAVPECKVTVYLEDPAGNPIDGLEVSICKVADRMGNEYQTAKGFENSGISVNGLLQDPSVANGEFLLAYILENGVSSVSIASVSGKAVFPALDQGIWLVYCEKDQEYYFNPYFAFLPQVVNGKLYYEVDATPKTENQISNNQSIYIVKKWEDNNNAAKKRPEQILVDLKLEGKTLDTVKLHAGNGWSYTFTNLPEGDGYRVEEHEVTGYRAQYSGDIENGFIITNIYDEDKLPQTGQLWWPITILAVAGIAFVVLGIVELKGKKDEESRE